MTISSTWLVRRWGVACLWLWGAAVAAQACSIPVFRYALDHWKADHYRLAVAGTDAQAPAVANLLRNLGDSSPLNLRVIAPPAAPSESHLLFPADDTVVWSGSLNGESFAQLRDSPVRARLVKRLLAGDSGAWLFIDSGRAEMDDSEAARLQKRLAFLETVAALPRMDPSDPANRLGPGPALRVGFSVLRVGFDDARESVLRNMLLRSIGKTSSSEGPMAALVFGRGRVLGVWPTDALTDEAIDQACLFLLGACSCQAKNLNPGWDLLLSVDWDTELLAAVDGSEEPHPEATTTSAAPMAPERLTIEGNVQTAADERRPVPVQRWILLGAGGAGILLILGFGIASLRRCTQSRTPGNRQD